MKYNRRKAENWYLDTFGTDIDPSVFRIADKCADLDALYEKCGNPENDYRDAEISAGEYDAIEYAAG